MHSSDDSIDVATSGLSASPQWRLNGQNQLPKIILGIKFTDGIECQIASSNRCRLNPSVTKIRQ
jgi:hypothetical protein